VLASISVQKQIVKKEEKEAEQLLLHVTGKDSETIDNIYFF
jgi:hypothetical protein